jgi:predicted HTH domain antitoxin
MENFLEITIPVEKEILFSLKKSKEEFEKEAKFLIALSLYKKGKISLGKAAKLAGCSKIDFIHKLQFEMFLSPQFDVVKNQILFQNI